jgi:hypothetical protein
MIMKRFIALCLTLFSTLAQAQVPVQGIFPAAFNTTFDPNKFGGLSNPNVSFSCITAVVAGKCNVGFNATCNGTGSDSAAWAAWVTASIAANPKTAILYVPPGSNCVLDSGGTNGALTFDASIHGNPGIQNPIIWMYQATVSNVGRVGGWTFFGNNISQALVNAANPGDSCVVVNDGNVGRFTVGQWGILGALGIQTFGSPPNLQFFEFVLINSINGNSVCFASPLAGSGYKTTYPQLDLGNGFSPNLGGPVQLYQLEPSWNTNTQIFGGFLISNNPATLIIVAGKTITMQDTIFPNGIAPSVGITLSFIRNNLGPVEMDKDITTINLNQSNADLFDIQSSSVNTLNVLNSTLRVGLNGTVNNTNILNSIILTGPNHGIRAGATCCGRSNATTLNGVSFSGALSGFHHTAISAYSFSNGVLTISKASGEYPTSASFWVPGFKVFVGDSDGSNTCSPANTFTVLDVQDAGSNVNIVTTLPSVSFGNTCGAGTRPPTTFGAYQAVGLAQITSGPANLLSNPEMLPP